MLFLTRLARLLKSSRRDFGFGKQQVYLLPEYTLALARIYFGRNLKELIEFLRHEIVVCKTLSCRKFGEWPLLKGAMGQFVQSKAFDEPSIYFEPFLRSFILGASAGAIFEVIHVASKVGNEACILP